MPTALPLADKFCCVGAKGLAPVLGMGSGEGGSESGRGGGGGGGADAGSREIES